MKQLQFVVILMIAMLPPAMARGQHQLAGRYQLTIDVQQMKARPGKIYFWYDAFVDGAKLTCQDSAVVKHNRVQFTGLLSEPQEAFVSIVPRLFKGRVYDGDRMHFYLTPGVIKITAVDSLNTYTQSGGAFRNDYADFMKVKSFYDHQVINLAIAASKWDKHKDSIDWQRDTKAFEAMVDLYSNEVCKNWVTQHPASPVALLPLKWHAGSVIRDPAGVDSLYQLLAADIKALPSALDLKRRADNVTRSAAGNQAPLFTMADTAGKPVSLVNYRGQFVFLDFWASWCAPCRRENPNVIANFRKYRSRNFTVISVSLDSEPGKAAWLKAIRADGLDQWPNLSDLKGFNNAAALLYGVQAVPQNFLIDPEGKIVAKNLYGTALSAKLEEVLL